MGVKHRDEVGIQRGQFDDDLWGASDDFAQLEKNYREHAQTRTGWINECLERLHRTYPNQFPDLEAVCDGALDAAGYIVKNIYSVTSAMRGTGQGQVMYKEGIETCFDLYEAIYLKGQHHVVAYGGTNLGKTSCSHFLRFIAGPLNAIIRGRWTCVLNVYIPRRSVIDAAELSFQSLIDLYGLITIRQRDGGRPMGFKEYHDKVIKKLWQFSVEGKKKGDLSQSRTRKEIVDTARKAKKLGLDLLTMVDEVHYAPKKEGHLGRKIPTIDGNEVDPEVDPDDDVSSDENGIGAETLETVRAAAPVVCAFSATPDPNLKGPWTLVKMRYSPIYASTHQYFLGEVIAENVIPVWSFSEFYEKSGIDLSYVDSRDLNGKNRVGPRQVRAMYRRVLEGLQWLYENRPDGRPFNGSLVRLEKSNENADAFADFVEKNSDIKVCRYYGIDNKDNIREQLAGFIARGQKFCVVPTAACRMADDIPREVCYMLDFTFRTAYPTSLRQSTCGRAGGHGKESLVILSNANAWAVELDNIAEGHPFRNPSQHSRLADKRSSTQFVRRERRAWLLDLLDLPADDPQAADTIVAIKTELETLFNSILTLGIRKNTEQTRPIQLMGKIDTGRHTSVKTDGEFYYFPVLQAFSEERMQRLADFIADQTRGSLNLLRPNDLPEADPQRLAAFGDNVAVSVGTAGRGGKQGNAALGGANYEKRNKTTRSSLQSASKYANGRRPELLFSERDGVFTLCNISLPLKDSVTFIEGSIRRAAVTPKDHTWQHDQAARYEAAQAADDGAVS